MTTPTPLELKATAEEAARRSGAVLADRFLKTRTVEYKGGIDLVTDADKASERELLTFLRQRYPDHAILAEESGLTRGSEYRWFVDPLDGTTNYAHQVPHFCVSIAVEGPEGLLAAAIHDPIRDELFSAAKGGGAFLNGKPIRASAVTHLGESLLSTGFPYDVRENPQAPVGLFANLIRHAQGIRRMGAAALDLAYVAAGRMDAFFEFGLKPWDIAAGALLVAESGGKISRIDGAPLDLYTGDTLAAAPGIYPDLSARCSEFLRQIAWKPSQTLDPSRR